MENGPCIDDCPTKTSIYEGFSMAMLNNQMVIVVGMMDPKHSIFDNHLVIRHQLEKMVPGAFFFVWKQTCPGNVRGYIWLYYPVLIFSFMSFVTLHETLIQYKSDIGSIGSLNVSTKSGSLAYKEFQ